MWKQDATDLAQDRALFDEDRFFSHEEQTVLPTAQMMNTAGRFYYFMGARNDEGESN